MNIHALDVSGQKLAHTHTLVLIYKYNCAVHTHTMYQLQASIAPWVLCLLRRRAQSTAFLRSDRSATVHVCRMSVLVLLCAKVLHKRSRGNMHGKNDANVPYKCQHFTVPLMCTISHTHLFAQRKQQATTIATKIPNSARFLTVGLTVGITSRAT